jgi:hypothetical protein
LLYLENANVAATGGIWVDEGALPYFDKLSTKKLNENDQEDGQEVVDHRQGHFGHRNETCNSSSSRVA